MPIQNWSFAAKTVPMSTVPFPITSTKTRNASYHRLKRVDSFSEIDDIIFKFASGFAEDEVSALLEHFTREIGDVVSPVSTGQSSIDLIIPGMHKAFRYPVTSKAVGHFR